MKMHYNPKLKELAKNLRKNSTLSEIILWNHLKGKRMMGYDFHRQKPIGEYIVDFYCPKLMLAIEIDGSSHDYKGTKDEDRARNLRAMGVTILRYDDRDIKRDLEKVLVSIRNWLSQFGK